MTTKRLSLAALLVVVATMPAMQQATAGPRPRLPFTQNLTNTAPLVFGMSADDATAALGVPLVHISGKPGNEVFAAERPSAGNFAPHAKLFLQFRKGRLTGWKGDWERNWMWQ